MPICRLGISLGLSYLIAEFCAGVEAGAVPVAVISVLLIGVDLVGSTVRRIDGEMNCGLKACWFDSEV